MSVPITVEATIATTAISRLLTRASFSSGMVKTFSQCSSVNPTQVKLYFPVGSLNEKTTITAIGISR
jgi:hypothetical protein